MFQTTIKKKIYFVCAFITLSLITGGGLYKYTLHTQELARLEDQRVRDIEIGMEKLNSGILEARRREKDFLIRPDQRYVQKHQFTMEINYNRLMVLDELFGEGAANSYLEELNQHLHTYEKTFNQVVNLTTDAQATGTDNQSEINSLIHSFKLTLMEIAPVIEALSTVVAQVRDDNASYQEKQILYTTTIVSSCMVLFGIIVLSMLFILMRGITVPLKNTIDAMTDIADGDGDLSRRLDSSTKDELGQVAGAFNMFATKIADLVERASTSSSAVAYESEDLEKRNETLAARTEEQASSLEETASSISEITTTVQNNAELAGNASKLAQTVRDEANKGREVIKRAVAAMNEINSSSNQISEITATINDIAFQTNLLALNAAVEAARAGNEGRGFAVVANEVRALSHRCADAAKEIKGLIEVSVDRINVGTDLVNESGNSLINIVNGIGGVTDMVQQIDTASHEQAVSIDQVNSAVSGMDTLTQQNSALVEETRVASQSMKEQAQSMMKLMEQFKTEGHEEIEQINHVEKKSFYMLPFRAFRFAGKIIYSPIKILIMALSRNKQT